MGDHREYQKRIKRYDAQIKYVDSVFEAEICKPVERRDEALLNECLDTLDYLHDSRRKLIVKLEAESPACVRMAYKRPRLAFATSILLMLLLGTGVAQAIDFRIWTALIHWDAGYLSVNYVPEEEEAFDSANGSIINDNSITIMDDGIIEPIDYPSIDDALNKLDLIPMLPMHLPDGFDVDRVYGNCGKGGKVLNIVYKSEQHSLSYKVDEHLESESAVTVVLPDNKEEYKKYKRNSITYTLTQTGTMVYATWTNGYMIYTINTDLPYEEVLLIIDSLEVYTK